VFTHHADVFFPPGVQTAVLKQACLPEKWETPKSRKAHGLNPTIKATLEQSLDEGEVQDADWAAMAEAYPDDGAPGRPPRPAFPTVRARLQRSLPDWRAAVADQW